MTEKIASFINSVILSTNFVTLFYNNTKSNNYKVHLLYFLNYCGYSVLLIIFANILNRLLYY